MRRHGDLRRWPDLSGKSDVAGIPKLRRHHDLRHGGYVRQRTDLQRGADLPRWTPHMSGEHNLSGDAHVRRHDDLSEHGDVLRLGDL